MSINWLGILQPQDASLPPQPGGCAQCHTGLGAKPNLPPTEADHANVDCLLCHSPNYQRTVMKDESGKAHLVPAEGVDVVAAAQNAQRPTVDMCGRCHFKASGGPNFKHGDFPTGDSDVHVNAGLQCVDCHTTEAHKIAGGGYMIAQERPEVDIACSNCHTEAPHVGGTAERLNGHTARVSCQTCHIPRIAQDPNWPTQMTRNYTQPTLNATTGLYGPKIEKASNVVPTYLWWADRLMETPPTPVGSIEDEAARITPWKPISVTVPFDAATHTPVYIKQGTYKIKGDLNAAVNAGVQASGQEYSGAWEPVTELMYFDLSHQVRPASEALGCADCHTPDGVLDFVALNYTSERAAMLQNLMAPSPGEGSFTLSLAKGLNMVSVPLKPETPYTASSLAQKLGATVVIKLDESTQRFVGFTVDQGSDGFEIEGGKGYIVNVQEAKDATFTGTMWTDEAPTAAPTIVESTGWAFVVSGSLVDTPQDSFSNALTVWVRNTQTGAIAQDTVDANGHFAVVFADLNREPVAQVGNVLEVYATDASGQVISYQTPHRVQEPDLTRAYVHRLFDLSRRVPTQSALWQNYPNPFNPETWIPYELSESTDVALRIYDVSGDVVRVLSLGHRSAGVYLSRSEAAYWDGKNDAGERVSSGVYFYQIQAGDFSAMRRLVILK